jgi:hypothetical protein
VPTNSLFPETCLSLQEQLRHSLRHCSIGAVLGKHSALMLRRVLAWLQADFEISSSLTQAIPLASTLGVEMYLVITHSHVPPIRKQVVL